MAPSGPYDYNGQPAPFWIDYISDTGDRWDSTYTVAYYTAQDELTLALDENCTLRTERGHILIFGGDEVYPTASLEGYERRLVLPYTYAFPEPGSAGSLRGSPHVFAPLQRRARSRKRL